MDLLAQPPLADGNVIYNFHFYDPHEFTHQGAYWDAPWWSYMHGIPYPATEGEMPEISSTPTRSTATGWNSTGWTTGTRIAFAC